MRRATLIVNPQAGGAAALARAMPRVLQVLEERGLQGEVVMTSGPKSAAALALAAVAGGSEIVFACGGDGTVHEVLQGMVHGPGVLGMVPVGTANALARHLGLSLDPETAVRQQMDFEPTAIAVGEIRFGGTSEEERRYFAVMAGAGPDGALVYSLLAGRKARMGRSAYYAHAARLFLTRRFRPFRVEYRLQGENSWQQRTAASVMAVRVTDLGGMFSRLSPGASLHDETLRLLLVRPPAMVSLPAWFALGQIGLHSWNPWLEMVSVQEFRCETIDRQKVHAQVDGEWMGGLPFAVRMVPDAVRLLMPRARVVEGAGYYT